MAGRAVPRLGDMRQGDLSEWRAYVVESVCDPREVATVAIRAIRPLIAIARDDMSRPDWEERLHAAIVLYVDEAPGRSRRSTLFEGPALSEDVAVGIALRAIRAVIERDSLAGDEQVEMSLQRCDIDLAVYEDMIFADGWIHNGEFGDVWPKKWIAVHDKKVIGCGNDRTILREMVANELGIFSDRVVTAFKGQIKLM